MTLRDYLVDKINEVADSWSDRVHGLKTRTPEDKDDLLRAQGMNIAANIIMSVDLSQMDEDVDEEDEYKAMPLAYLAKSLDMLARADVAIFAKGWQEARGCRIEHECAERYGIPILEEEG